MHGDRPTLLKLWVWWTKFTDDRSIIIEKDQLGNSLREKLSIFLKDSQNETGAARTSNHFKS